MKSIDIRGMTNMELVRGGISERFPGDIRIMPNGEMWLVR